ncbi:MAG: hypothetical protein IJL78_08785 [Lachnospiraceae bacterium]|nr:hypothetical protein [Lachnospiraceae bacterium]
MNKKIQKTALFALVVLLILVSLAPKTVASTTISIEADREEASPGDTINFTVVLGPVSDFGAVQMALVIPDGLTYLPGSGALAPDLKRTLGFDLLEFTEESLMVTGVALTVDYSSTEDTVLCTFQCTVDEGFSGMARLDLSDVAVYSCVTLEELTERYIVNGTAVYIPGEPGGDETEEAASHVDDDSPGTSDVTPVTPDAETFRSLQKRPLKKEAGHHRPAQKAGTELPADTGDEE